MLPTLGPELRLPVWLYADLDQTGVTSLQDSLYYVATTCSTTPLDTDSIQSVAGFASLHVGIILTLALVTQYTVRHAWIRCAMWVYFALTVVSTLYFGWHYIADDVAGAVIAVAVGVARRARHRAEVRPARPRARTRRPRRPACPSTSEGRRPEDGEPRQSARGRRPTPTARPISPVLGHLRD